ncbi:MAG: PhzF family phenazine biosynthesis protein [Bacteroidota bacterium]
MKIQYYTCDVFTDKQFSGNQLAVFPDATNIPDHLLQQIAKEFNLSETSFVYPPVDSKHTKRVRIFTPGGELPFAGHPTIGTAITLGTIGAITLQGNETTIILEEGVGPVPVKIRLTDGKPTFAQLAAAKLPEFNDSVPSADILAKMFTLSREEIMDKQFPLQFVGVGFPFLFVAVKNRKSLERISVNVQTMEELRLKEVFVFTTETEKTDFQFRARMFAPLLGIPEDPATGSACAAFAGYLAAKDPLRDGTLKWNIEQGFEMGRPSLLYIEADKKAGNITGVRVGGNAVMMMEGFLEI